MQERKLIEWAGAIIKVVAAAAHRRGSCCGECRAGPPPNRHRPRGPAASVAQRSLPLYCDEFDPWCRCGAARTRTP